MKVCTKCKVKKPLDDFYWHKSRNRYQSWCKKCQGEYSSAYGKANPDKRREAQARFRNKFIEWYHGLKAQPCTDCGVRYPHYVMEWDHLPGFKKVASVSDIVRSSLSKEKVLAEIAKCELVCANCHNTREWERSQCIA